MPLPGAPTPQAVRAPDHHGRITALRAAAALAGVFLALAIALWLIGQTPTRVAGDQNDYHLVAIKRFAAEWPAPNLGDYPSATTPGYHLLLAAFARYASDQTFALQLVASLFTVGLLATLGWVCARRARTGDSGAPWAAIAFALPVAFSPYVVQSGVWLLPDNAAWWGVLVAMALALSPRPMSGRWLLQAGVVLAALVLVRQNHIWTAGVLLAGAWLGPADSKEDILGHPPLSRRDARRLFTDAPTRARRAAEVLLVCLPACAILGYFVWRWGGLTPPSFQGVLRGGNLATPAFVLALLGIYGVFFLPVLWTPLRQLIAARRGVLLIGLALAIAVTVIPATTADEPAGRYGALWSVVREAPVLGGRTSLLLLVLAPLGMVILLALLQGLPRRDRWVMLVAVLGFTAAQSASHMCWQRYIEPFLLIVLALSGSAIHARLEPATGGERRLLLLGPVLLGVGLLALSLAAVAKG